MQGVDVLPDSPLIHPKASSSTSIDLKTQITAAQNLASSSQKRPSLHIQPSSSSATNNKEVNITLNSCWCLFEYAKFTFYLSVDVQF